MPFAIGFVKVKSPISGLRLRHRFLACLVFRRRVARCNQMSYGWLVDHCDDREPPSFFCSSGIALMDEANMIFKAMSRLTRKRRSSLVTTCRMLTHQIHDAVESREVSVQPSSKWTLDVESYDLRN